MKSLLINDTTKEERIRIVHEALWGSCGIDCEFCSGCDNRGGGRIESIYQPYIDGLKEIREINEGYPQIFGADNFRRWHSSTEECQRFPDHHLFMVAWLSLYNSDSSFH